MVLTDSSKDQDFRYRNPDWVDHDGRVSVPGQQSKNTCNAQQGTQVDGVRTTPTRRCKQTTYPYESRVHYDLAELAALRSDVDPFDASLVILPIRC
jgi:hypothetical protein